MQTLRSAGTWGPQRRRGSGSPTLSLPTAVPRKCAPIVAGSGPRVTAYCGEAGSGLPRRHTHPPVVMITEKAAALIWQA